MKQKAKNGTICTLTISLK
uniref:Uncharacterized protein n=1 Tax=Anguilla anguilla TaxID=7936 RepID=A0A0E9WGR2_ANGAN